MYFTENTSLRVYFKNYVKFCMLWKRWKRIKNVYHSTWKGVYVKQLAQLFHIYSHRIKSATKKSFCSHFHIFNCMPRLRLRRVPFINHYCISNGLAGVLKTWLSVTSRMAIIWGIKKEYVASVSRSFNDLKNIIHKITRVSYFFL